MEIDLILGLDNWPLEACISPSWLWYDLFEAYPSSSPHRVFLLLGRVGS